MALGRGSTDEDYETLGIVEWGQFQDQVDGLIQKTEENPERYFVSDFPDESVLGQMQFEEL